MFRSYRYHPHYSQNVRGGFRSLTYSHSIDPNKPICMNDIDGVCTDPKCKKGQHWNKMGLSDDMILVQLGTKNPGQTEDERKKWTEGLKEVVKVLRQRGVNDPELVAKEIANYRRRFLGDETRVLNL
ncbi:hypothetical protein P152DRAFT_388404 [Eremomyces bilateralis CBS 781.70]|uniref:Uncharacterized protein n=1 Tax=Eremomyces bilateralis CBS 781.70 TaxID=1392243 RepID=A0A6G1GF71_9PEZI|nr:uncharacterized protein P152DRAFT_388404 [Eremomyces bilateralis CBS 781.70]KAF1816674.1 hypothetical protein P152DRAFT_388404 [Eremomyces bilateralis CBS 781.70]